MTMLWIGLAVFVVLLFAAWRLRRASRTVDRIVDEERTRTITDSARDQLAEQQEESRKRATARRQPDGR
jgi:Sec-independent protein translocase protein TatA